MNRNIILYCYLVALTVLVVVLSVKVYGKKSCKNPEKPVVAACLQGGEMLPVAYINLDTLLTQYTFAIEANDRLMSKQESARATYASKARTLQNEMADFQRKLETNAFLSRDYAGCQNTERQKRGRNDTIYERLEPQFTFEQSMQQSVAVKGAATSHNSVQQMLKNWRTQGLIVIAERGRYRKIEH